MKLLVFLFFLWTGCAYGQLGNTYVIKADPLAGWWQHEFRMSCEFRIDKSRYFEFKTKEKLPKLKFDLGLDPNLPPKPPVQPKGEPASKKIFKKLSRVKDFIQSEKYPHFLCLSASVYHYNFTTGLVLRSGIRNYFTPEAPCGFYAYAGLRFSFLVKSIYNGQPAPIERQPLGYIGVSAAGGYQWIFGPHRHFVLDGFMGFEYDLPSRAHFYAGAQIGFAFRRKHLHNSVTQEAEPTATIPTPRP